MSRQRLRESSVKWSINLTNESFALKILKMIEIKSIESNAKIIDIQINEKVLKFIEDNFKADINYFQKKNKVKLNISALPDLNISEYFIEFKSKSKKVLEKIEKLENLEKINKDAKNLKTSFKQSKKRNFKKKKYFKKKKLN